MRSVLGAESGVKLNPRSPLERAIVELIDTPLVQRMKHISHISTAFFVYPDAIHSRFGHIVGSACLTSQALQQIRMRSSSAIQREIDEWGPISAAFALCHDLGHLAPGSHLAQKVWFPNSEDLHEEISHTIIQRDTFFREKFDSVVGQGASEKLDRVMREDPSVPRWTWQIITGGGWNTDRGDWVPRDSAFCGVNYGKFDNTMILERLRITPDGDLAIDPKGIPCMELFLMHRAQMYREVYQHDVARIAARMHELIGQRARELFTAGRLAFADDDMRAVLRASAVTELELPTIYNMTDGWWQYHIQRWASPSEPDQTLRELSSRVLLRRPFKRFDVSETNQSVIKHLVDTSGLDPNYFYFELPPATLQLVDDLDSAPKVLHRDGTVAPLAASSEFVKLLRGLESFTGSAIIAAPEDIWKKFKVQ